MLQVEEPEFSGYFELTLSLHVRKIATVSSSSLGSGLCFYFKIWHKPSITKCLKLFSMEYIILIYLKIVDEYY